MAYRKTATLTGWHGTVTVARDAALAEYRVRLVRADGAPAPECDYFTDDRGDAMGTARAMAGPELAPWHVTLEQAVRKAAGDADASGLPQAVFRGPGTCGWTNLWAGARSAGAPGVQVDRSVLPARYFN